MVRLARIVMVSNMPPNPVRIINAPTSIKRHSLRDGYRVGSKLGFGVPYFNTFFLKGNHYKKKFILFSPWLLKSPVKSIHLRRVESPANPNKPKTLNHYTPKP